MKSHELEKLFKDKEKSNQRIQCPAAIILYQGEKGIALLIGENLVTGTWLNGDIIVHWEGGEHTILPDEFELIKEDVWSLN